jgi:hypothetical protein
MWLEAILSSTIVLLALIIYFQSQPIQNTLLNYYKYTLASDIEFLLINSNLSLSCLDLEPSNACIRCEVIDISSNTSNISFSSSFCEDLYLKKPKNILSTNQLFYQDNKLKKLRVSIFYDE